MKGSCTLYWALFMGALKYLAYALFQLAENWVTLNQSMMSDSRGK